MKEPTTSEQIRALGVVMEDMRSQMALVVEATTSTRTELRAEMRDMRAELSERISVLESVVRQNSVDIQKNSVDIQKNSADIQKNSADIQQNTTDIRQNSADILALREQVAGLRHDFDHRTELGRVSSLETRVSMIESRLGIPAR